MTFLTIGAWILAGWLALVGLLFLGQRSLLYHPDRTAPDADGLTVAGFRPLPARTEDGLDLVAWHRPASEGRPTLVLFHGNAGHHGHRVFLVAPLLARGYGVVLAPYRGFGGSPGKPSEDGLVRDGKAVVAALEASGIGRERVVLWGESLGSGVATRVAADAAADGRPVRALVLQSPFTSVYERAAEIYKFVPARWLVLDRFDNRLRIASVGTPVLIVHGEEDTIVPVSHGRGLFEAAIEPKKAVFIPGAEHNDMHDYDVAGRIADFLEMLD